MSRETTNTLIKILFNFVSFEIIGLLLIVHLFHTKQSVRYSMVSLVVEYIILKNGFKNPTI